MPLSSLRERLYQRLRGRPYPLFVFAHEATFPAAALWTGARAWTRAFREAGVQPGDRLVLALPPSAAFVQVVIAALWEGITLVPIGEGGELSALMECTDARWGVALSGEASQGIFIPEGCSGPDPKVAVVPRTPRFSPTPDAALLMRTSGTGGEGRWIALSLAGVLAALDSHLDVLGLREEESRMLSVLPWHHVFGFVFDLLVGMFSGAEIVRDPAAGRDTTALLALAAEVEPTWLNAVPLTIQRLAHESEGRALLQALKGGVIGGAPIPEVLVPLLQTTKLRVGYGQTEASPGIALGDPGSFLGHGYLGQARGCETRQEPDGTLAFRGANVCLGYWDSAQGLVRWEADRWHNTGDLVAPAGDGGWLYQGRIDDGFKLSNGVRVEAGPLEQAVLVKLGDFLDQALLHSPDGATLELLVACKPGRQLPCREHFFEPLGALAGRLQSVRVLPASAWVTTPKGTLRRLPTLKSAQYTPLALGPDSRLTCEEIERIASNPALTATLTPTARVAMEQSVGWLEELRRADAPIYGTTTGFGPFVRYGAGSGVAQGAGLIAHLGAGFGDDAPACVVRATIACRAQNLAQGHSAIRPELLEAYLKLLGEEQIAVPLIGSVGASGDLVPLGHIARVLAERIPLEGREALSLTNGTSFLTAYAALATARAARLLAHAEALTGWLYRTLGCRASALDPRLHRARGHQGQIESAAQIAREAGRFGEFEDKNRPLQEVYSLRCAPQVLGACRENLSHARRIVETELNGVSDNPLFFDGPAVAHGGNFHGQQVAFAADALNAALVQVAVLAERQLDALITPGVTNGYAPLLLAWEPGPHSGLAGAQLTATALVAEMRAHGGPAATLSIPTNGGNQDVVSMGTLAARLAYAQTERLAGVLGILALALTQYAHLQAHDKAPGPPTPPVAGLPEIVGLNEDRPLREDIARLVGHFLGA